MEENYVHEVTYRLDPKVVNKISCLYFQSLNLKKDKKKNNQNLNE